MTAVTTVTVVTTAAAVTTGRVAVTTVTTLSHDATTVTSVIAVTAVTAAVAKWPSPRWRNRNAPDGRPIVTRKVTTLNPTIFYGQLAPLPGQMGHVHTAPGSFPGGSGRLSIFE